MLSSQIFLELQSTLFECDNNMFFFFLNPYQDIKNYTGKGHEGKNTDIDWSESLGTSVWESKLHSTFIWKTL